MAKAHSFIVNVGTPIASAASSSSRMADHARPTRDRLRRVITTTDKAMATATFHWFFLIQPFDLPERMIGADPAYWLRTLLGRWSGGRLDAFDPAALAEYERCFSDPASIHATCEDYRAGATIDCQMDEADLGRRKIACPMLVLWGSGRRGRHPDDVVGEWRKWAADVRGHAIECGHFLPEEKPAETAAALREFLSA